MITREQLENFHKRQVEINKQQAALNNEFGKYKTPLFERVWSILQWKDENLGLENLRYKSRWASHISKINQSCLTICLVDNDPEIRNIYFNIPYDEIFSDDWKEKALEDYEKKKLQKIEEEKIKKEQAAIEKEEQERALYERLRIKFENKM